MDTLLRYGLLAVFIALVLTPFGLPIPEDLSLLVGGVLAGTGQFSLYTVLVVGWFGVMIGDAISWSYGYHLGTEPKGFVARLVGKRQLRRIERFYRRYGTWAIVIARQVPGMRLPAFFFAGATGIALPRFLVIDGLAALITVHVYVLIGWAFSDDIGRIVPWLDRFRALGGLIVVVAIGVLAWRRLRWRQERRSPEE